jgi:hypothetical protein
VHWRPATSKHVPPDGGGAQRAAQNSFGVGHGALGLQL